MDSNGGIYMKRITIFYSILLALWVCQIQPMYQSYASPSLPSTPFAFAQIELNKEDLEELGKIADFEGEATATVLPQSQTCLIEPSLDFSRSPLTLSLLKGLTPNALAIPAAAQTTQTNKRKNEKLHQCQASGCNYKGALSKLQEHI